MKSQFKNYQSREKVACSVALAFVMNASGSVNRTIKQENYLRELIISPMYFNLSEDEAYKTNNISLDECYNIIRNMDYDKKTFLLDLLAEMVSLEGRYNDDKIKAYTEICVLTAMPVKLAGDLLEEHILKHRTND